MARDDAVPIQAVRIAYTAPTWGVRAGYRPRCRPRMRRGATVLMDEARALGLDLADLIAAADGHPTVPTVGEHVAAIEATFTAATASSYRPYWRLAVDLHGSLRLTELGIADLQAVVEPQPPGLVATGPARTAGPRPKRALPPCEPSTGARWTPGS